MFGFTSKFPKCSNEKDKSWILSSIIKNTTHTGQLIKVCRHVSGPNVDGSLVKEVTDHTVSITAVFTVAAVQSYNQQEDFCTPPDFDTAVLIVKDYSIDFIPSESQTDCKFVLVVNAFSLLDLHEGFSSKNHIQDCMEHPKVQEIVEERWSDWLKEKPPNSQATQYELSDLLDEIGQPDSQTQGQPDSQTQTEGLTQKDGQGMLVSVARLAQSSISIGCISTAWTIAKQTPFSEDMLISPSEFSMLNSIEEWREDYRPPASLESKSTPDSLDPHFSQPTLAEPTIRKNREGTSKSMVRRSMRIKQDLVPGTTPSDGLTSKMMQSKTSKMSGKPSAKSRAENEDTLPPVRQKRNRARNEEAVDVGSPKVRREVEPEPCHSTGSSEPCHPTGSSEMCQTTGSSEPCHPIGSSEMCQTTESSRPCHPTGSSEMCQTTEISEPCHSTGSSEPCCPTGSSDSYEKEYQKFLYQHEVDDGCLLDKPEVDDGSIQIIRVVSLSSLPTAWHVSSPDSIHFTCSGSPDTQNSLSGQQLDPDQEVELDTADTNTTVADLKQNMSSTPTGCRKKISGELLPTDCDVSCIGRASLRHAKRCSSTSSDPQQPPGAGSLSGFKDPVEPVDVSSNASEIRFRTARLFTRTVDSEGVSKCVTVDLDRLSKHVTVDMDGLSSGVTVDTDGLSKCVTVDIDRLSKRVTVDMDGLSKRVTVDTEGCLDEEKAGGTQPFDVTDSVYEDAKSRLSMPEQISSVEHTPTMLPLVPARKDLSLGKIGTEERLQKESDHVDSELSFHHSTQSSTTCPSKPDFHVSPIEENRKLKSSRVPETPAQTNTSEVLEIVCSERSRCTSTDSSGLTVKRDISVIKESEQFEEDRLNRLSSVNLRTPKEAPESKGHPISTGEIREKHPSFLESGSEEQLSLESLKAKDKHVLQPSTPTVLCNDGKVRCLPRDSQIESVTPQQPGIPSKSKKLQSRKPFHQKQNKQQSTPMGKESMSSSQSDAEWFTGSESDIFIENYLTDSDEKDTSNRELVSPATDTVRKANRKELFPSRGAAAAAKSVGALTAGSSGRKGALTTIKLLTTGMDVSDQDEEADGDIAGVEDGDLVNIQDADSDVTGGDVAVRQVADSVGELNTQDAEVVVKKAMEKIWVGYNVKDQTFRMERQMRSPVDSIKHVKSPSITARKIRSAGQEHDTPSQEQDTSHQEQDTPSGKPSSRFYQALRSKPSSHTLLVEKRRPETVKDSAVVKELDAECQQTRRSQTRKTRGYACVSAEDAAEADVCQRDSPTTRFILGKDKFVTHRKHKRSQKVTLASPKKMKHSNMPDVNLIVSEDKDSERGNNDSVINLDSEDPQSSKCESNDKSMSSTPEKCVNAKKVSTDCKVTLQPISCGAHAVLDIDSRTTEDSDGRDDNRPDKGNSVRSTEDSDGRDDKRPDKGDSVRLTSPLRSTSAGCRMKTSQGSGDWSKVLQDHNSTVQTDSSETSSKAMHSQRRKSKMASIGRRLSISQDEQEPSTRPLIKFLSVKPITDKRLTSLKLSAQLQKEIYKLYQKPISYPTEV